MYIVIIGGVPFSAGFLLQRFNIVVQSGCEEIVERINFEIKIY